MQTHHATPCTDRHTQLPVVHALQHAPYHVLRVFTPRYELQPGPEERGVLFTRDYNQILVFVHLKADLGLVTILKDLVDPSVFSNSDRDHADHACATSLRHMRSSKRVASTWRLSRSWRSVCAPATEQYRYELALARRAGTTLCFYPTV